MSEVNDESKEVEVEETILVSVEATPVTLVEEPIVADVVVIKEPQVVKLEEVPVEKETVKTISLDVATDLPDISLESNKSQRVFLDAPVSIPREEKNVPSVPLPSDSDKRTNEILSRLANIDIAGTEKGSMWAATLEGSIGMSSMNNGFISTLENPDAEFRQTVEFNNLRYASSEAKFPAKSNSNFDGELAVLRMVSHLGMGSAYNTALWNSGFWVTFKPPSEEALVELHRQMTSDQIEFGRSTYGLAFSNTTSYSVARLAKFAVNHIFRIFANNEEIGGSNILQHIKVQDINAMLWGMACTMFPKGFAYSRACTNNPEKCTHVVHETLNLRKLQVVNLRDLTDRQKSIMADNRGKQVLGVKDLQLYQSDMVKASVHRVVINEGKADEVAFILRSPSVEEYIESGNRWVSDMTNLTDQALGSNASVKDRNDIVELRARASIMRQFSHWVSEIQFGEGNTIKDRASIESTLTSISGDKRVREEFTKAVTEFTDRSSVSVIGIPTYDCPACGTAQESQRTYPFQTTMIPLDIVQLFFVLLTLKHRDLQNR